jgi:hypothetical protein
MSFGGRSPVVGCLLQFIIRPWSVVLFRRRCVFFTNGMLIKYLPVKNTCKGGTVSATIAKR